jgi:ABC-2 type transport system permease protein
MAALYRLFLGNLATRGRLIGLTALGVIAIIVGFAMGASDIADPVDDGTLMIAGLGLALIAPVVTLVLTSATLGDPNEDGTPVYLWLRPTPRWQLALSALAAGLTVSLPMCVIPLAIAAGLTGAGSELVMATIVSCSVAVVGYGGLFTWLGLRMKRAMAWGLAYILVWEGFIARAGDGTEALSIRSHTVSVLSRLADGPERLWESTLANGILVPVVAAVVAAYFTGRRLQHQDVA